MTNPFKQPSAQYPFQLTDSEWEPLYAAAKKELNDKLLAAIGVSAPSKELAHYDSIASVTGSLIAQNGSNSGIRARLAKAGNYPLMKMQLDGIVIYSPSAQKVNFAIMESATRIPYQAELVGGRNYIEINRIVNSHDLYILFSNETPRYQTVFDKALQPCGCCSETWYCYTPKYIQIAGWNNDYRQTQAVPNGIIHEISVILDYEGFAAHFVGQTRIATEYINYSIATRVLFPNPSIPLEQSITDLVNFWDSQRASQSNLLCSQFSEIYRRAKERIS